MDTSTLESWLAGLSPANRVPAADLLLTEALGLVSWLAAERRAALVEAVVQGQPVPVAEQAVRKAVRPDRKLLVEAAHILMLPGVCSVSAAQLAHATRPRAPIAAVTQRVWFGLRHVAADAPLDADQQQVLQRASARVSALLGDQAPD